MTDAFDLARMLHEGPTNFTEPYFPTRIVTDLISWYGNDKGGEFANFMYRHRRATSRGWSRSVAPVSRTRRISGRPIRS